MAQGKVTFGNVIIIIYKTDHMGQRSARKNDDKLPISSIVDEPIWSQQVQHLGLLPKTPIKSCIVMHNNIGSDSLIKDSSDNLTDKSNVLDQEHFIARNRLTNRSLVEESSFFIDEPVIDPLNQGYFIARNRHVNRPLVEESGFFIDEPVIDPLNRGYFIARNHSENRSFMEESCIFFDKPNSIMTDSHPLTIDNPSSFLKESNMFFEDGSGLFPEPDLISEDLDIDDFEFVSESNLDHCEPVSKATFMGFFSYFQAVKA